MSTIILPALYTAFFIILIGKTRLFSFSGLSTKILNTLFVLKVGAGSAYTFLYDWYYGRQHVDVFNYFRDSQVLYETCFQDVSTFLRMFSWNPGMPIPPDLVDAFNQMDYWTVWGDYTMIRINALFRFLSFGNIYVHVVFLCFLSLAGLVLLYHLFSQYRPGSILMLATVFLAPSVLFWGSGVHKEPLVLFVLGVLFYHSFYLAKGQQWGQRITWIVMAIGLLFLLRWYLVVLVLPVLGGYLWTLNAPRYALGKFVIVGVVFVAVGEGIAQGVFDSSIPEVVVEKRQDFQTLEGGANLQMSGMEPSVGGLVTHIPEALSHVFLRPYWREVSSPLRLAVFIENCAVLVFVLLPLWKWRSLTLQEVPLFYSGLLFSIGLLVIIGWTVNNPGAMVRYKAQYYPLLLSAWGLLVRLRQ